MKGRRRRILLIALSLAILPASLMVGPTNGIHPGGILEAAWKWLSGNMTGRDQETALWRAILIDIRLPRVLLTFLVGGSLTASGCALQALFRNPLVDPYILGLSSGAAFGAALAMAVKVLPVQASAFIFSLAAAGLSVLLGRRKQDVSVVTLVLAGVIVNGVFTSLLTIVQFLSDPFRLQTIVHWTMGNLHNAGWTQLRSAALPMAAGSAVLMAFGWRLNVLALGDEETRAVGLSPEREKLLFLVPATLCASAAVSVAGVIGLVGLVIPHMVRIIAGPEHRVSMPLQFLIGGAFLLLIDDVSRSIASFEIPIGVFTMLIGAPVFIWLMRRNRVGWES